jgi:large subunit ribosomal protein L6
MSRVGKHQVVIPAGIQFAQEGNILRFKKGNIEESYETPPCLDVEKTDAGILIKPLNRTKQALALWGTTQRNIFNIVFGLDKGFSIDLELVGVGYKASVNGKQLVMQLGYSHDIIYDIPENITIACPKPTTIAIKGASKKAVGDVASLLRGYRKPEPYKGKGVMRSGEFVYRKEGKKK